MVVLSMEIWIKEKEEQMKRVQEFSLELNDKVDITLPRHSKILSVQEYDLKLYLWAVVDDSETKTEIRHLRLFKNDCEIDEELYWDLRYLCSVQNSVSWKENRTLHIFEYEEYDPHRILHI
jgi:hypothetical protein